MTAKCAKFIRFYNRKFQSVLSAIKFKISKLQYKFAATLCNIVKFNVNQSTDALRQTNRATLRAINV
ncbi:hypothetical protein H740_10202 [Campylobacter showae CC57C]|uniref:Uncharacterized protein n=1 Tax=Campylobacter showae CC57C TaxID=1073353 RepID=M3II38_9BACT|nr:hypothetical protein H740_10202 [Campylobacter showae CC57C]